MVQLPDVDSAAVRLPAHRDALEMGLAMYRGDTARWLEIFATATPARKAQIVRELMYVPSNIAGAVALSFGYVVDMDVLYQDALDRAAELEDADDLDVERAAIAMVKAALHEDVQTVGALAVGTVDETPKLVLRLSQMPSAILEDVRDFLDVIFDIGEEFERAIAEMDGLIWELEHADEPPKDAA
jgi:hypothetical protein